MDEIKQEETRRSNNHRRNVSAAIVFIIIAAVGIVAIYFYIEYKKMHITTDDAYVEGNIYTVASKVPGTVRVLHIDDNQFVKKGDVLVELDPVDYDVKVSEASSSLNAEGAKIGEIDARITASKKQLAEAIARADAIRADMELREATREQAARDKDRAVALVRKEAMSREKYEQAMTAYKVAEAQVTAARENLKSALSTVEAQRSVIGQAEAARVTQQSTVKQKEAALDAAKLNSGYTKIYAATDGYVTKKSVEVGNQVQAGQPLVALVPLEGVWVVANYKETQLTKVRRGQKVEIKVDTYPGKKFSGTVDSIMAGTGAAFSLFPPENATGNFVKVVQRIPVKILLDKGTDPGHVLRVGMSVVPTVVVK